MLRILIVDDEAAIIGLLKTVLESSSFEVHVAKSAADAKSRLDESTFDLVLTDMRMETPLAGYEVVRAARQIRPRPATVILTAFPIPSSDWRPSGADALLVKGADILDLPNKLQDIFKQHAQRETQQSSDMTRSA